MLKIIAGCAFLFWIWMIVLVCIIDYDFRELEEAKRKLNGPPPLSGMERTNDFSKH